MEEIAKKLDVPKEEVTKFRTEIIEDRRNWNKKESVLKLHEKLISSCIRKEKPVKEIYDCLRRKKIKTSYSTVCRFVKKLKRKSFQNGVCPTPGAEAVVYLVSLGNFEKNGRKVTVWMFCLRLLFSQYCYHCLVTDNSMTTFLRCHAKAFMALGGAPKEITRMCCREINMQDAKTLTRYNYFLYCCGSSFSPKGPKNCQRDCDEDIKYFRKHFLTTVLHSDYNKLKNQLDKWINTEINLSIRPGTGSVVKNQFLKYEKNKLNRVSAYTIKKSMKVNYVRNQ